MNVFCSKKLRDVAKIIPEEGQQATVHPLYSWHAHLLTLNRRKTLVMTNDLTRYGVVIYGLKAREFQNLQELMQEGIRQVLLAENIRADVVEKYLDQAGPVHLLPTRDRSMVARLNVSCRELFYYSEKYLNQDDLIQTRLSRQINRSIFKAGDRYEHPNESMYKALGEGETESILACDRVQIRIDLMVETEPVWRRLVVPLSATFEDLHWALQRVFNWRDYHLYSFYLPNNLEPEVEIVCDLEDYIPLDNVPYAVAAKATLSQYLHKYKEMVYVYDFGDDWVHQITVEDIQEGSTRNTTELLDGAGDAPPEDVGGPGGFEEFLRIRNNPDAPGHREVMEWAKGQRFLPFGFLYKPPCDL